MTRFALRFDPHVRGARWDKAARAWLLPTPDARLVHLAGGDPIAATRAAGAGPLRALDTPTTSA